MYLLDVNVLLAAHREDHPHHSQVQLWFEQLVAERARFAVPATVWGSFLRLATNRRIFAESTPLDDAFEFIGAVCGQPGYSSVSPGPRHLHLLRRLCQEANADGDLIPDAVLGAIALEHDCELVSLDRDFARFQSVRYRLPTL